MFRHAVPLGQRPCGIVHRVAWSFDPLPQLVGVAGLLAAGAHLRWNSRSAWWLLSILATIGQLR